MLFGDTWPTARSLCSRYPSTTTRSPRCRRRSGGVPLLTVVTDPRRRTSRAPSSRGSRSSWATARRRSRLQRRHRRGRGVGLVDHVRCRARSAAKAPVCRSYDHLHCTQAVGDCMPSLVLDPGAVQPRHRHRLPAGHDVPAHAAPGSASTRPARRTTAPRPACPPPSRTTRRSPSRTRPARRASRPSARLATNKFINVTTRTVGCFTGSRCGSDYGPGHGALLMWGRPGFQATRRARSAALPPGAPPAAPAATSGDACTCARSYFAGVDRERRAALDRRQQDAASRWRSTASSAAARTRSSRSQPDGGELAGRAGEQVGDAVRRRPGRLPAGRSRPRAPGATPGAVHPLRRSPWGPWTPPRPHLLPGSPDGRRAFRPRRRPLPRPRAWMPRHACAPGDPTRPPDFLLPGCPQFVRSFDVGLLYAPNVIDAYTRPTVPAASTCSGTPRRGIPTGWRCCGAVSTRGRQSRRRCARSAAGRSAGARGAPDERVAGQLFCEFPLTRYGCDL